MWGSRVASETFVSEYEKYLVLTLRFTFSSLEADAPALKIVV